MEFKFNPYEQNVYMLYDYETVDALLKVKFWSGEYVIQTKIDMFAPERDGCLDPDIYELRDDEPIYIFDGINNWVQVDWEIEKVLEVLEWKV